MTGLGEMLAGAAWPVFGSSTVTGNGVKRVGTCHSLGSVRLLQFGLTIGNAASLCALVHITGWTTRTRRLHACHLTIRPSGRIVGDGAFDRRLRRVMRPPQTPLGLSDVMLRHYAPPKLHVIVDHTRLAIPRQPTVISVGGKMFAEAAATAGSVGAHHARVAAAGASIRIADLVRESSKRRTKADPSQS